MSAGHIWLLGLAVIIIFFSSGALKPLDWVVFHIPLLNRFGAQEHSFFAAQVFIAMLAGFGIDFAIEKRQIVVLFFLIFCLAMIAAGRIWFGDTIRPALAIYSIFSLLFLLAVWIAKKLEAAKVLLAVILFMSFALDLYSLAWVAFPASKPDFIKLPIPWQELEKAAGQSGARSVEVLPVRHE